MKTTMRIFSTAAFASSAALTCFAGPIDFNPTTGERKLENIVFTQLILHQDGHAISYEPPRDWTVTGGGQLTLVPKDVAQAKATIEQAPLPAPKALDETSAASLRQVVLAAIPPDAQNAKVVAEETNPGLIKGQPSYSITANYGYFGQDYAVSMLFANLGDIQLRAKLVARKGDFESLQRAFRGSLYSLHWD